MMRAAWAKRRIVLLLGAINLAAALLASEPLSAPLARLIDLRPSAAAIADSADDAPRAELLEDHPELVSAAVEAALLAMLLYGVWSWVAAGGLLADRFVAGCADNARRMLAVGVAGAPLRLIPLAVVGGASLLVGHAFSEVAWIAALTALVAGFLWSLTTVILDRARGLAVRDGTRAWKSVRASLSLARRQPGRTILLALFSGGGFLAVTALQLALTHLTSWSLLALTAGVLGALGRAWFTSATLLAAGDTTVAASARNN